MREAEIAIVGGGLVGAALGYGLARSGARVLVLDGDERAPCASRGNFGLVWVQGKGEGCPAYARWTMLSANLWCGFARELADATGIDVGYSRPGGVTLALNEAELAGERAIVERIRREAGDEGSAEFEILDRAPLAARPTAARPTIARSTIARIARSVRGFAVERRAAGVGQLADQPVRLDRVSDPWRGPALANAASDRLWVHYLAVVVEQRQLAAGLADAAREPPPLRRAGTRPAKARNGRRRLAPGEPDRARPTPGHSVLPDPS